MRREMNIPHHGRGILTAVCLLAAGASCAWADGMVVATGGGYRRPMNDLVSAYEAAGGAQVGQVFGNVGQITAQARASDAVAMVCDDQAVLARTSGLSFRRFVPLGTGRLVVAYRKGIHLSGPADVADAAIRRVAIADVQNATYGKAGLQYLTRAGLQAQVQPKLLTVSMVPQVTAYLIKGEVDAGFVNLTEALGAGQNLGGWVPVDASMYAPIHIACGILDEKKAAGFAAFLESRQARAIEAKHGL